MRDGMKLREACTTVAKALRGHVPGISTGKALETYRETLRRDPTSPEAEWLRQARTYAIEYGPDALVSVIREQTQKKPE